MNQQQFGQEESPRSQRMTEDEAKAIIDLWQREQTESGGLTTSPTVQDVAEGLDISEDDVRRLLQKVRARWAEAQPSREQQRLELAQQRLADEERRLAAQRREWEQTRRRQAQWENEMREYPVYQPPSYSRPTRSLPLAHGISPVPAEELSETARNEARIRAEGRRFGGFLLAMLAVIVVLMMLLALLLR